MQPEKLGRYEILKEIGRGAMGRVFLAHDPQIDRKVAIKTIHLFSGLPEREQAEARERFLREARSAGKLLHPGIVTIFDVGDADGTSYLAMELVEGDTLDKFCRTEGLLPLQVAVELVARVAEALDYAHSAGIVHRDIKPANMMRTGKTSVKVMDFGLARASEAQLTQEGALLGTPSYMSPEQIRGEQLDGRSDLFSLAVVLFEMLTGEKPFPGDSISSIIYRIVNEEPRDAAELHESVPGELSAFVRKAMDKDPQQRFANGKQFAIELRRAAGTVAPSDGKETDETEALDIAELPPSTRSRPPRSSPVPYIFGAVVLIGALAAAGYYFRDQLGIDLGGEPVEVFWEAQVRTEPPGLEVLLDGQPIDPAAKGVVRFKPEGPFGMLSVTDGCRTVERQLDPADAAGEIVLVVDPTELAWTLDPGVDNVAVTLNGESAGVTPAALQLDLCRDNELELKARGYRETTLEIPAQKTPLEARTLMAGITLEALPMGKLVLPASDIKLDYYVDGQRAQDRELELPEGEYQIRWTNEKLWIDVRRKIAVHGGETAKPGANLPALTTLVVQPYPSNCKVYLRRPGGSWKFLDDAPTRSRVAVGKYELRVKLNPTGETNDQMIELVPGENPPVRVNFGRRS